MCRGTQGYSPTRAARGFLRSAGDADVLPGTLRCGGSPRHRGSPRHHGSPRHCSYPRRGSCSAMLPGRGNALQLRTAAQQLRKMQIVKFAPSLLPWAAVSVLSLGSYKVQGYKDLNWAGAHRNKTQWFINPLLSQGTAAVFALQHLCAISGFQHPV